MESLGFKLVRGTEVKLCQDHPGWPTVWTSARYGGPEPNTRKYAVIEYLRATHTYICCGVTDDLELAQKTFQQVVRNARRQQPGRRGGRPRPGVRIMTTTRKLQLSWRDVPIYDSDGGTPDGDGRARAMREFRDHESMQGYWFVDLTCCREENPGDPDTRVWDEYNHDWRESWNVGPAPSDIDYTGL